MGIGTTGPTGPLGATGATGPGGTLSNATPVDLGTAAPGVATEASRADHVHDMPSAADVGADALGSTGTVRVTQRIDFAVESIGGSFPTVNTAVLPGAAGYPVGLLVLLTSQADQANNDVWEHTGSGNIVRVVPSLVGSDAVGTLVVASADTAASNAPSVLRVTAAGVVESLLDGVDTRIDGVDTRIDGVDTRIDGVDTRIDNLGADDIAYVGFGLLAKASHQVDQNLNAIEGILDRWKFVSAFATVNVDLSSLLGPSEVVTQPTLDGGVAPIRGSYIWLFGQSTAAENGCYYVGSDVDLGVWVRQNDPNTFDPPGNGYRVTCNASGSSVDGVTFMWIDDDRHKQLRAVYSTADPTFGGASSPSGRWVRLATPSTDLTTPSASGIPATLLDAKGDLIVATAADTAARLAVGSDGQVLTADAASSGGVKWAAGGLGIPTAKLSGATDRDWTIPGVIATAITTWTPSTNRAIFQPIVVTAARNYDLIGVEIVTAAAAGKQGRVAIYSIDDYWQPDTRVWQSATFAIDPASVPAMVTTTGPGVLDAGPYMVIFTMDASPTLRVLNVYPPMDSPVYFGAGGGAFRGMTSITSRPTYVASGFPALAATDSLVWDYVSVGSAWTPTAIRFREAA